MAMVKQSSIPEMVSQSRDIISNPSVPTFERYEHRGTLGNAAAYVVIAAVIAGLLGLVTAILPGVEGNGLTGFVGGVLGALVNFFIFTGLVFFLGRSVGGGSGSWDEVAYTFSLFAAPLTVIGAVVGLVAALFAWVPVLGALVGVLTLVVSLAILAAQIYFGYLGVQSSMNITDQGKALTVLVLAALGTMVIQLVLGALSGLVPLLIFAAVLAAVIFGLSAWARGRR